MIYDESGTSYNQTNEHLKDARSFKTCIKKIT